MRKMDATKIEVIKKYKRRQGKRQTMAKQNRINSFYYIFFSQENICCLTHHHIIYVLPTKELVKFSSGIYI